MELKESSLKSLLDSTEDYVKTSVELLKLKAFDKGANKVAEVVSRAVAFFALFMFVLMLSIGVSLWLGSLLGNPFYGFLIVAGFYALLGLVLFFVTHNWLKKMVADNIVKQAFKD